ncbi:glycosyl hydrolases family 31-domain-containing protein [Xylariomycetidae sp. FL2044]|nr:glycosyl hydrolases family 31-domain-containing protein [Xylariomycetidae sp. FL2044]
MLTSPDNTTLEYRYDSETLRIEAWGPNALRVRATHLPAFPAEPWALTEPLPPMPDVAISIAGSGARIRNGVIQADVSAAGGKLVIRHARTGKILLEEYVRQRKDVLDPKASALRIGARSFVPRPGSASWHLTARFEAAEPDDDDDDGEEEKIYGMGQYQQRRTNYSIFLSNLNLKGLDLELAQRNSQASVPFAVSSRGYGLLWNNPAVGRAVFGRNLTTFEAYSTDVLDYWVVAAAGGGGNDPDNDDDDDDDKKGGIRGGPAEILRAYASVVGTAPPMPEYGLGFWQCKLRYQTQDEVLAVAREHKVRRGLPMDVIVVDFFHWPKEGEWKFDPTFWPDPDAMIAELKSLGIELMVSIWPTVDRRSENYEEMVERGLLIRQDRGWTIAMEGPGDAVHYDATNPAARRYVWEKARAHYHDKGVRLFWLDEAEPEYTHYDFDNYRYHLGPDLMVGNVYPLQYARGFYEGMREAGQEQVVNLVRCCWAGSQKYGALLWSGDIASSWTSLRNQLSAGLNAGLAGIPWWTTDIGGFHGGDPGDPAFRELFARWFQWGAFCPVFRLHGDREPRQPRHGTTGGSWQRSGAANEVWSYGDEVYGICRAYLGLREALRPYVRAVMRDAHARGDPVIRPLFYDFPRQAALWSVDDQYMFGPRYLVAPVLGPGRTERSVVLPEGARWRQFSALGEAQGDVVEGGRSITVQAPLGYMPVFERQ